MTSPRLLSLVLACALATLTSATTAPTSGRITRKELAQGFRDTVILAKPLRVQDGAVDRAETAEHVRVRQRFAGLGGLRVIQVEAGDSVAHAIARLQRTGRYEFVEPDYVLHPDITTPTDPYFPLQWALSNTAQKPSYTFGDDIRALAAWDVIHDAPDVVIALVDSGVRADHEDIAPNLWQNASPTFGDVHGASFVDGVRGSNINDENGHGTHVAGIICASANNGVATAGVVWRTQLMVLKNSGADGLSLISDSAACIDYAVAHGAKIINCSWGGLSYSKTLYTALKAARDAGVIVVCAAGNDGVDNDISAHYPSNYLLDNMVAVGNSTGADAPNASSNYGNLVELFAPGTEILSLNYASTTGTISYTGTSMAAPHVTGALALLKQHFPNDTYRDSINRLLNGITYKSDFVARAATNGRLNIENALAASNHPYNYSAHTPSIITGSLISIRSSNQYSGPVYVPGDDPVHVANGTNALWWVWFPPAAGNYVIDTAGSDYDTGLDVYTGDLPGNGVAPSSTLTPLVANDDDGPNKTSRVRFTAVTGDKFFVSTTTARGSTGYTQLNISLVPENDNFADAKALTGASDQDWADNRVATLETGEPAILGQTGTASLWYKWTAPRTGKFQVSAYSASFDPLLAIYTGTAVDHLTLVTADDDTDPSAGLANEDSRCTLTTTAGTTYYFQVETKSATARGEIITTVTDSLWQLSNDSAASFTASPAVGRDGTLYIGAAFPDHRLYAVAPDGSLKWTYSTAGAMDTASPAIGSDGTIYQGSADGHVVALKSDGSVVWNRDFGAENAVNCGITIASDGTLYLHAADGDFYALNPADGSTKWRYTIGAQDTYASAAVAADGTIYQGSDSTQTLYALNPDGTLKWWYNLHGTTYSTPAIDAAGNVYFATYSTSTLSSLSPTGALRWTLPISNLAGLLSSSPTLSADGATVYIGGGDKKVHAVDSATGLERWAFTCGGPIYASTAAVDSNGVIYIGAYDGKLYGINSDGTLKRTWDTARAIRSSPVIYGTTLYVGSNDAKLYAFDIGATLAAGPWPEYRHDARRIGRVSKDPLAITTAPISKTIKPGDSFSLSATASGDDPLTYQWKKDGVSITGATSSTYLVASATTADAGSYTVVVSGPQGTVTSTAATVTVITNATDAGRLINVSIRTIAASGDQSLIVGVSIGGADASVTKPLLMRAVGPTLAKFGVPGVVQNPILSVNRLGDATILASNDGWRADAQISAVGRSVGAFDLDATSTDAALYHSFSGGSYTMQVSGKDGLGMVLVEAYDATPAGTFTTTTPRLTNVSARTQVGTGDNVLILGFAIGGSTSKRLLVRAVGPELTKYSVGGVLADPKLEIYKSIAGGSTYIDGNDNWVSGTTMTAAINASGAFGLTPGSKDAAMVIELQPGTYSAVAKGVGDTTGVALVELYELP